MSNWRNKIIALVAVGFAAAVWGPMVRAGLESATFLSQLVSTNPLNTDPQNQGDDHLRLIKAALQSTFPNADKAFRFPRTLSAKSSNYTVLAADENATIPVDTTSGAVTLTLPATGGISAGYRVFVVKTNTGANPVFIVPASGNINGFSKVRRSVEFVPVEVQWTGSIWVATRQFGQPIGSAIEFHGTALPNGTLYLDGSSFNATNYVELGAVFGSTLPDRRERVAFGRDNLDTVSRLSTASGCTTPQSVGSTCGVDTTTLLVTNIPQMTVSGTTGNENQSLDHTHSVPAANGSVGYAQGAFTNPLIASSGLTTGGTSGMSNHNHSFSANVGTASPTAFSRIPPAIIANILVVAE